MPLLKVHPQFFWRPLQVLEGLSGLDPALIPEECCPSLVSTWTLRHWMQLCEYNHPANSLYSEWFIHEIHFSPIWWPGCHAGQCQMLCTSPWLAQIKGSTSSVSYISHCLLDIMIREEECAKYISCLNTHPASEHNCFKTLNHDWSSQSRIRSLDMYVQPIVVEDI